MQIIIVGCGKVGYALAEQLSRENNDVTVIDADNERANNLANIFDVRSIVGNGASYAVLTEADIEHTDLIIAVTGSDELNLLCCVVAKKAGNNCYTIARVRNPVYSQDVEFIRYTLGISMIINPELITAQEIARLLRFPSAIDINVFNKGRVELLTFRLPKDSILNDVMLKDVAAKLRTGVIVLVCAVERDNDIIIPNGMFSLKSGDLVSVIASPVNAAEFFKKISIQTNQVKDTIIIGGSATAYYLSHQLLKMGIKVKIVERSKERCEELSGLLPDASIILGNGGDQNLLLEERIDKIDSFVALTGFDEENILLSLYAATLVNKKVITKINRSNFDMIIHNMNLGSVVYPKNLTTESILSYVRAKSNSSGGNVETLYRFLDDKLEALEFLVTDDTSIINIPLMNLKIKKNMLIGCISRHGKTIIPTGKDVLKPNDSVIIVTKTTGLLSLKDIID